MDVVGLISVLQSVLILVCITLVLKVVNWAWFRPRKLEKLLREQGLDGNAYSFFLGDVLDFIKVEQAEQPKSISLSDDIIPHILPYYHQYIANYGKNSFIWFGNTPMLNIADPELIKEVLMRPRDFHKPGPDVAGRTILGGLFFLEDDKWAKHRKIINPAFHLLKLKDMTSDMFSICSDMVEKWETLVSNSDQCSQVIDVWPYLEDLSGDVISRTAFGVANCEQGRTIFELQREQAKLFLQLFLHSIIPGLRYVPTKANRKMNANAKRIKSLLTSMIKQREMAMERGENIGNDLLGIMMKSNYNEIQEHGNKNVGMSIEDIIGECKLFYFAGSETTSNLLAWTLVMLSKHQHWQALAREEVLQVFGKREPTFEALNQLKIVTMIFQEVLRLYPPVTFITRAPTKTTKLGNMTLPAGVQLTLLISLIHHDTKIWGDDVKEFNPHRFAEGVSSATSTKSSFIPFSSGPRFCIGQNFAMIEAKMALAMILQRFSFKLSPSYLHAPFNILTLQPQYGVPLVLTKL